jgi:phosphatidylinositol alpha-1,6-mannosyltransferase
VAAKVLFVSKPIVAPFHDGTKCLVRDIALHLDAVKPVVLATPGAEVPVNGRGVPAWEVAPVYRSAGHFTPSLLENLRAALWIAARSRADLWHFVFAPNPRTSSVGRVLKALRGVPVVQTVASPPRDMTRPEQLLFGDVVVAQSRWTAQQLRSHQRGEGPPVEVIPPPVPPIPRRSPEAVAQVRHALGLADDAPVFVYPGDLEVSSGAERVARLVAPLVAREPKARVVFAYRQKTPRADECAERLRAQLNPEQVRFSKHLGDILALVQGATAVLFPVDDLWGKVDLPIVLLEAMSLGVPVLALDEGPLQDLEGARRLPADDAAWLEAALALLASPARAALGEAGRAAVERHFRADQVAARYQELYLALVAERHASRAVQSP